MSVKFNEKRSMVSVRLPDELHTALLRITRIWECTLTETIERLCYDSIENGFCDDCKARLLGKAPFDLEKIQGCNGGEED